MDGLKAILADRLGGMQRITKDMPAGQLIYRGVECTERPDLISRISYPPVERVTRWGRLNRRGESVFYGSIAPPGVFYELKARAGDLIAFSQWEVIKPMWMHNLGYHADALTRLGARPADHQLALIEPIVDESEENRDLRRRVAMAFTEDVPAGQEQRYRQTVAIKEFWCDHLDPFPSFPDGPPDSRIAGIVYPSLQMRGDADNIVLWPEFVHSSLRLRQVQHVLVEAADPDRMSFTWLTVALSQGFHSGSTIVWQKDLPPEPNRRCQIALEEGVWVQRDGFGRVYGGSAA